MLVVSQRGGGAMAAAYSSRDLVEDFLRYKLLGRGVAWPQRRANDERAPRPGEETST